MRDEIKQQVLAEVRSEKFITQGGDDGWPSRIKLFGRHAFPLRLSWAIRMATTTPARFRISMPSTPDRLSTRAGLSFAQYNVDTDRNRFRIRFRLGGYLDLGDGFTGGFRIATGENNSPVTTNQSISLAKPGPGRDSRLRPLAGPCVPEV